jgi:uncharacterized repeat protein (TIGR01451 family)
MFSSPNTAAVGGTVTYNLIVTNLGPATATGVAATNTLPPGVSFVSATPAGYQLVGNTVIFPNLGSLASGATANASVTVRADVAGIITNTASCGGLVSDPLKGNNSASVKTVVEGPALTVTVGQNTITLSWPVDAGPFVLESANSLQAPIAWTVVSSPPPQINSGVKTVTVGTTNGVRFFRLRAPVP